MSKKILIVDDEVNVLKALERLLRRSGYTIVKAEGGPQAIKLMENHDDFAVIISDQRMPEMSGAEVLRQARTLHPDAVRIALSGYADSESILDCINKSHVSRFLLKPWDDEVLREIVSASVEQYETIIEKRQLEIELTDKNEQLESFNNTLEDIVEYRTKELQKAKEALKTTLRGVVEALSDLMERHRSGMLGGGQRIAKLSVRMGVALNLSHSELDEIETAALLHDIGTVHIPKKILEKAYSELTPQESFVFQNHPVVGSEIIKNISGFANIAKIIRHHHEAVNGTGYPDKLSGDQIPLGARIIAIVDMFDDRMFLAGKSMIESPENAASFLTRASGSILDSSLVKIFCQSVLPSFIQDDVLEVEISLDLLRPGMILARDVINVMGIPLLKTAVKLDNDIIAQLKLNQGFDPVVSRLFVLKESVAHREADEADFPDKENNSSIPEEFDQHFEDEDVACSEDEIVAVRDGSEKKSASKVNEIVVVDDQQQVIHALRRELKRAGYAVKGFLIAHNALQYIQQKEDLFAIITDYSMPGMKGDEFLAKVQEMHPNLPCIVITGMASKEVVASLVKSAKITAMLTKPWDRIRLLEILDNFKKH